MSQQNMPPPRSFAVRVFKGPTLSTFAHNATAKFDVGYRPSANVEPRQTQNWYGRPEQNRSQPASVPSREPLKTARFGTWNENRGGRETPHPATMTIPNYADFIYERSLSSKSDIYSDESPSTSVSTTPTSLFSPAFSANSTVTSTPSEDVPVPSARLSTFPLNLPALTQAQSSARALFVHPNGDISQTQQTAPIPIPGAPPSRTTSLPDACPPVPLSSAQGNVNRVCIPLSESPQEDLALIIPPPRSESEATVGEAERLALRNAQINSAGSAYYQAGFPVQSRSSSRSPERSSSDTPNIAAASCSMAMALAAGTSSSIVTNASIPGPTRTSPTMVSVPARVACAPSDSSFSSVTVVDAHETTAPAPPGRVRRDSFALRNMSVPVSQLVDLGSPVERERLRGACVGEELRGLDMNMGAIQRDVYANASASGTHRTPPPLLPCLIPAVVRSDSGDERIRAPIGDRPPPRERRTSTSGSMWNSLSQLPDQRRSPTQLPARPSSTPPVPLPRIDTSGRTSTFNTAPAPPPPTPATTQQSPTYRAPLPPPLIPPPNNASVRARTPVVAGPRVLPTEPVRRRSDGDQPINSTVTPNILQRTTALFHGHRGSDGRDTPAPRPTRPGSLPLDPQRRRSDGFQSVVPPRPNDRSPQAVAAQPQPPVLQLSIAPSRNVRWNDNLVCPSPIFPSQRRKGWFNRRGDQLWTNDGAYKPVAKGQEFPDDLRDYPEFGMWMNEEGVKIDMGHRLVPKLPLRSALKQSVRGPIMITNPGVP
ncbi:hypothetical protein MKEN_01351300 [Mycena kentingensis (nom. inval.)]|nr:hypothetical protein MKEN_01351300 [Mycena kentingensis (nom. inval.)]